MATARPRNDVSVPTLRDRRHLRSALIGLAVLPALAGVIATALLLMATSAAAPTQRLAAAAPSGCRAAR